jgi:hypothetical protein
MLADLTTMAATPETSSPTLPPHVRAAARSGPSMPRSGPDATHRPWQLGFHAHAGASSTFMSRPRAHHADELRRHALSSYCIGYSCVTTNEHIAYVNGVYYFH